MSSQSPAPRNPSSSARLVASKGPGAWGSNQTTSAQSLAQNHDASSSWAQAMNPRSTAQLDLSSSSFPSLAGGPSQSNSTSRPISQWQEGPPIREQQPQAQNTRTIQQRQHPQSAQRETGFGETFSRPDFSSLEQSTRLPPPSSLARGAPPGLAPLDGTQSDVSSLVGQPRKSPTPQNINGSIGQERANGELLTQSPPLPTVSQGRAKDPFAGREPLSPNETHEESSESSFQTLSERDKWGMKGYHALHSGHEADFRAMSRQQDLTSFQISMREARADGGSLLRRYAGPFAPPNAYPPRPLDSDYTIPDCYIVQNVAPVNQRITGFTEDTLFYIFYTSPKDMIQEEVATELMSRKWRFHMKEKMWLTRDDTTVNPVIIEKDVAEQGYYIWWDYRNWKRIRKPYVLRYEDLDDHLSASSGRLQLPGQFNGGSGAIGGANVAGANNGAAGNFNAVPGLERLAALGGRGF